MVAVLRKSGGGAVAVPDIEIVGAMKSLAREGVFASPEGAATLAGYRRLLEAGAIARDEEMLLYNTGTGLKYLDLVR
jgi:threonine synthase